MLRGLLGSGQSQAGAERARRSPGRLARGHQVVAEEHGAAQVHDAGQVRNRGQAQHQQQQPQEQRLQQQQRHSTVEPPGPSVLRQAAAVAAAADRQGLPPAAAGASLSRTVVVDAQEGVGKRSLKKKNNPGVDSDSNPKLSKSLSSKKIHFHFWENAF